VRSDAAVASGDSGQTPRLKLNPPTSNPPTSDAEEEEEAEGHTITVVPPSPDGDASSNSHWHSARTLPITHRE
jgi:hypothetical protein